MLRGFLNAFTLSSTRLWRGRRSSGRTVRLRQMQLGCLRMGGKPASAMIHADGFAVDAHSSHTGENVQPVGMSECAQAYVYRGVLIGVLMSLAFIGTRGEEQFSPFDRQQQCSLIAAVCDKQCG